MDVSSPREESRNKLKLIMKQKQEEYLNSNSRKMSIRIALKRLKQKNEQFLTLMDGNQSWRKIYNGLLANNIPVQLSHNVTLKLCQVQGEDSYFDPFTKIPITMCYNKFSEREKFQEKLLFNLVLLYDSKIKRDMNWNNIQATARSTIRALNISKLCKKNDKECYKKQIYKRVQMKERFVGKQLDFDRLYDEAIEDVTPISQITFN